MTDKDRVLRQITHALAEVDREAYVTNPNFRVALDTFSKMLIPMVEGLAAETKRQRDRFTDAVDQMLQEPPARLI